MPPEEIAAAPAAPAAPAAAAPAAPTGAAAASTPPAVSVSQTGGPTAAEAAASAGKTDGKWYDSYDAQTKDYIAQKQFADPKAVLDSYRNLEKLRGVPPDRLLKLPDAPDAPEWNDVYSKLGKPATPAEYGLIADEGGNPETVAQIAELLHKYNLPKEAGAKLVADYQAIEAKIAEGERAAHDANVTQQTQKLKTEWGAAYNQNVMRAQQAFKAFGIPDAAIDSLEKSIGFDGVMKMMHTLGTRIGEHGFEAGQSPNGGFGDAEIMTPDQAKARIKSLKEDEGFRDRYLKGDVKAKAQMARYHQMAYPSEG